MPERTYRSHVAPLALPKTSIWTLLFVHDRHGPSAADEPAFIDAATGTTIARGQLRRLTLEFAWGLRHGLHARGGPALRRGDAVMVFSPNSVAWPISLYGTIAAGLRCTPANSAYTPAELAFQWTDSRAKVVIVHPALLSVVLNMFKSLGASAEEAKGRIVIASFGVAGKYPDTAGFTTMEDLLGKGALEAEEKFEGEQAHETAVMCYSSGTTGKPKGVETTHYNITSVLLMTNALCELQRRGRDRSIGLLPFYHIYGLGAILTINFYLAVPVIVMEKFDPIEFCCNIERYKITYANVVPPILLALARHPATDKFNVSSLTTLMSGAAPLSGPLASAVRAKLASVGSTVRVTQGFGLTETSPIAHVLPPEHSARKVGSVGLLVPNLELRLVDEGEDGGVVDVPEGEPGEMWLRGPNVMKGYLNNEAATKNAITSDGWFKTGDIAIRDSEGFFYIVDRKKELIKYKGFQVPPAELESKLLQHPGIADAAVIGVESVEEATELPRAYVVSAKPLNTDAEKAAFGREVQKWIEGQVAKHKYLRGGVVIIDAIPKSAAGKILRKDLRERAKAEQKTKAKL